MRILVRAPNWIGDCLMMTPFLKFLKERYTDASVTVLCAPGAFEIFEGNPHVDKLLPLGAFTETVARLRGGGWDSGYILPNSFSSALLFYLAGIKNRVGYDTEKRGFMLNKPVAWDGETDHRVVRYIRLVDPGIPRRIISSSVYPLTLSLPEEHEKILPELKEGKLVILNPCSTGISKRWLPERYAEVARRLTEMGAQVAVTGGPAREEKALAAQVVQAAGGNVINIAGTTTLRGLAAVLKRAKLLITGDTGIMHVAAAVRTPTLVLVGPSDIRVTSPWNGSFSCIDKHVYCSPCMKNRCINRKEPMLCMTSISSEEVLDAAVKYLNKERGVAKA